MPHDIRVQETTRPVPPPSLTSGFIADWRFLTILPLPTTRHAPELDVRSFPLIGWILGALAAAAYLLAAAIGLPPLLCALLALGCLGATSGLLHEDGLADVADSMGGRNTEQRLAILRDSRIGAYGVSALCFCLLLRLTATSALGSISPWTVAAALMTAAALSRAAMGLPARALPQARAEGLSADLLPPPSANAIAIAALLALAPGLLLLGIPAMLTATLSTGAILLAFCWWARRHLGGRTGDVLGASQVTTECACLLAFTAVLF